MAVKKEKQYLSDNAQLIAEWDWEKNKGLDPYVITWKSDKKAWWRCPGCGNSWDATIKNRSNGRGCPYCAGQKVWIGYNDLATNSPDLAKEWHPVRNAPFTPQDVTTNSGRRVWWQCKYGHEWAATVYDRNKGNACPYCSGRTPIVGETDLATTNPEIAAEWHPYKNGNLLPTMVSLGTSQKVWWQCAKGHEWQAVVYSRQKNGCPICSGEARTSFPEQTILFYFQQVTAAHGRFRIEPRTEIDVFLPELQIGIEYDGVHFHKGPESAAREQRKENTLEQLGITLIRVKETDASVLPMDNERVLYCKPYPNNTELTGIISKLQNLITEFTGCVFSLDVDVARDRGKIYSQYVEGEKNNSLLAVNPVVAAQWHPYRNGLLTPLMVTANSNKTVWWQCEHGHEWQAVISSRNRGNGCPYCGGLLPIRGENDLATVNPILASQWHPTKNGELTPNMVLPKSNKLVWWRCGLGHEWKATIYSRNNGNECPYCSNHRLLDGFNDFATKHPELVNEWYLNKNEGLSPRMFVEGSEKKVWWLCSTCGNEWKTSIKKRSMGQGCPECGKRKSGISLSQTMLQKNGALAIKYPDIAGQWHPTKNGIVLPSEVTSSTHKKYWWMCVNGHEWEASVAVRTRGGGCPICSGKQVAVGINDLATKMPELAKQWHPTKNGGLTPESVTISSWKLIWWKCEKGHEYQSLIYNRSKGSGCPYCAGHKPILGETDLVTRNPVLAAEWHPTKNGELKPIDVTYSSGKKVWWLCSECGNEWKTSVDNRNHGSGCPKCAKKK